MSTNYHSPYHTDAELIRFKTQIKSACSLTVPDNQRIAAYISLCDILIATPTLSERAVRTIKKLFLDKSPQIALNALNLIDSIIKNVPKFAQYITIQFLDNMTKALPKDVLKGRFTSQLNSNFEVIKTTETERINRTLVLIKEWAKALTTYPIFQVKYQKLVDKGVIFPDTEHGEQVIIDDHHHINQQQQRQQAVYTQPQQRGSTLRPSSNNNHHITRHNHINTTQEIKMISKISLNDIKIQVDTIHTLVHDIVKHSTSKHDLIHNEIVQDSLLQAKKLKDQVIHFLQQEHNMHNDESLSNGLQINEKIDTLANYIKDILDDKIDINHEQKVKVNQAQVTAVASSLLKKLVGQIMLIMLMMIF